MNQFDRDRLKKTLEGLLADKENVLRKMKENNDSEQDKYSPGELSNYDNHPAEMATELYQLEHNTAIKVHEEHLLKDIRDALGRMGSGEYGKCAFCGHDIALERLDAIPYTRLCISCEESKPVTPKILKRIRPNEELVLDTPLGRKYLNKREDDEHEGMDQFNDLMKYGSADSPQDLGGYEDYEDFYTNDIDRQGVVEDVDNISNDDYKRQLP